MHLAVTAVEPLTHVRAAYTRAVLLGNFYLPGTDNMKTLVVALKACWYPSTVPFLPSLTFWRRTFFFSNFSTLCI